MDEDRMLMALPPRWRQLVVDLTLVGSWAACVAICFPLIQLATDHSAVVCFLEAVAPGTLLFWGAIAYVLSAINRANERRAKRKPSQEIRSTAFNSTPSTQ